MGGRRTGLHWPKERGQLCPTVKCQRRHLLPTPSPVAPHPKPASGQRVPQGTVRPGQASSTSSAHPQRPLPAALLEPRPRSPPAPPRPGFRGPASRDSGLPGVPHPHPRPATLPPRLPPEAAGTARRQAGRFATLAPGVSHGARRRRSKEATAVAAAGPGPRSKEAAAAAAAAGGAGRGGGGGSGRAGGRESGARSRDSRPVSWRRAAPLGLRREGGRGRRGRGAAEEELGRAGEGDPASSAALSAAPQPQRCSVRPSCRARDRLGKNPEPPPAVESQRPAVTPRVPAGSVIPSPPP